MYCENVILCANNVSPICDLSSNELTRAVRCRCNLDDLNVAAGGGVGFIVVVGETVSSVRVLKHTESPTASNAPPIYRHDAILSSSSYLKPNSITLAGSKLVRGWSPTSFEPVCDQLRSS